MSSIETESESLPSLNEAFWYWFKLGFISFGGPAGQIAIMHQDLVENKRWISEKRFLHALNYCMLLPGPEAQQLAIYIGWLLHKTRGGLLAGILFILPSLFILITLSYVYLRFGQLPVVEGLLSGIKPAVVAIVLFAAYRIGVRTLKNKALWAISVCAFLAIAIFSLPFPLVILSAALLGILGNIYVPRWFNASTGHGKLEKNYGKAVIDDETPTPAHAIFNIKRVINVALVGIIIWLTTVVLLAALYGWDSALVKMAWFFTKASLMTFGGAYAVLPYVYQGAVTHYAWLTPTQMIDGLALGETTPGPLIMVVTFVGFLGGWSQHVHADPLFAGILAACVVTFFTFLPSFVFIFVGGPFIESTKNNLKLNAPLDAITAAVVGVITSLGLFFARHVFWPNGSAVDWLGIAAATLGFVVLLKLNVSVIKLILVFATLGFLRQWLD
ncbi:MAG: chromate efflux transporter [Methylophilaceae bacterium]